VKRLPTPRGLVKAWERFWFKADGAKQLRAFRLVFGLTVFGFYLARTPDLSLFYSDSGILRLSLFPEVMSLPLRYSVLDYFKSPAMLWVFHLSFLSALVTLAIGFYPRISAIIALFLHISFLYRNMAVVYGADSIVTYFLCFLCFASAKNSVSSSMAFRFSQLQVCIIYAYSGFHKLRGTRWWEGDAVWSVLANSQLARYDFSWVSAFPLFITFATYLTVLWEIYFPVLVWVKPFRIPVLILGILIHLGIGFSMSIPFFSMLIVATYILFLKHGELDQIERSLKISWEKLKSF